MVFSSINLNPNIYLDPTNWQVEHNQQAAEAAGTNDSSYQLILSSPLQLPTQQQSVGNCSGDAVSSFRSPASMTERARLAKVPLPEPGLKCPRCDSTNTKFCYFNNYNLSQPRHFCKGCRRYWTRGGALRNVPVGGGCRRNNKRSNKRGASHKRSKSPLLPAAHEQPSFSGGAAAGTDISQIPTGAPALPLPPPLMNHLGEYNSMAAGFHHHQLGSSTSSSGFLEQFRSLEQFHPFPFLTSFGSVPPPSTAMYSFDGDGAQPGSYGGAVRFKAVEEGGAEENISSINLLAAGVNMSKNMRELSGTGAAGNEQIWSGNSNNNMNAWTMDLSGFSNSCSTSNL